VTATIPAAAASDRDEPEDDIVLETGGGVEVSAAAGAEVSAAAGVEVRVAAAVGAKVADGVADGAGKRGTGLLKPWVTQSGLAAHVLP
jgi:hypothetical protein